MTGRAALALRYMWRQKARSGFVVTTYVAAVTVTLLLTSAVLGTEQNFISQINGLGVDWIYVSPGDAPLFPLTVNDSKNIARNVPHLSAIAPVMLRGLSVPSWKGSLPEITGTNESLQSIFGYAVAAGTFDLKWNGNVSQPLPMVVGSEVWQGHDLSVGQVVSGDVISLSANGGSSVPVSMVVTGLLLPRGSLGSTDLDAAAFIPILALEKVTDSIALTFIFASATSSSYVSQVTDSITQVLIKAHGGYEDFSVSSEQSWVAYVQDQLNQFASIISLVEATLLILSAMSVFVVMTMAVKDRRREIGVMRALGAHRSDIMGQFLLEASIMSVGGMTLGVFVGTTVAGYLKTHAHGFYSYLLTNPLSLGFYFDELLGILWAIGFLFSLAPAYQASRLEAVEALSHL